MIYLRFISRLLIISFALFIDIPLVISSLSQTYDEFHNPIHGYDLNKGPVIYEAYYPDENLKQKKNLFYHEPIIRNSWQNHYNTRQSPTSRVNTRNPAVNLIPLSNLYQSENNHVIDDKYFHGIGSSIQDYNTALEINYNRRVDNARRHSVDNIGQKISNPVDDSELSKNLRDQDRLVAKTYIEYWKLANALAHSDTYNTVPQLFTAQLNPRKQPILDTSTQENIFQPRPQIINYRFSLPIEPRLQTDKLHFPIEIYENDSAGIIINKQSNGLLLNEEPQIESIKVEGKRTHKVRHHHGEKSQQIS
ncbi:hypothetical protein PV328_002395 [Microctonus aethiopoides]|uniref:Uncharacterized protein n=1 Tax=Microctonus aethiopoides TaxID=144406 RepID=A0AA39FYZ4_9HYME|nr:hypothetical protein PV328_002395 [Microctonus aethiopoides]